MLICDCESTGFKYESTKIWVICAYDTETRRYYMSFDESVYDEFEIYQLILGEEITCNILQSHEQMVELFSSKTVCFHNYFQHDKPLIKKFYPEFSPAGEEDSYILSQLYNPDRGLHGLAAWGERFGLPKPAHEEWDRFSPEMLHRVIEDVKINVLTWEELQKEKGYWEKKGNSWDLATKIEYGIANVQGEQEMHGVLVDEEEAYSLADEIFLEIQKLDEYLDSEMPLRVIQEKRATYEDEPFTKAGKLKSHVLKWFDGDELVEGPFSRVSFEKTNLNAPSQIKDFLLSQGWKPIEWTKPTNLHPNGSPKMTIKNSYGETVPCPSLMELNSGLGLAIGKRSVLKHRAGILFGVRKKDSKLTGVINIMRDDGRIEAGAVTNATNTGRMAHRGLVNVPKPKDKDLWPSNRQIRSLFIVPDDKIMMGVDADGLEARMEAHACLPYTGGQAYAYELLEGDVHANNAIIFGTDRDGAKAPKYALTYGCQAERLAHTLGCPIGKARELFNDFWSGNTALSEFKEAITKFWKDTGGKYIIGIDGRRISTRSEHSLVNAYFQSTGSIVVKVAAMYLNKWVKLKCLDAQQIIIYHDELEYEVNPRDQDRVNYLAIKAFEEAGKFLKIRVPVTGSPKWGRNWEAVH